MSTISKSTYVFTVLHRTDQRPASLEEALYEAGEGYGVGDVVVCSVISVPDDEVASELKALGNDGEFFDDDLQEGGSDV